MGLFKSKEERFEKKAKDAMFYGKNIQNIGIIPSGTLCFLKINLSENTLVINGENKAATITLERVLGFSIDSEVNLSQGKTSIGRAIIGGYLFGGSGAIIGANSKKGNSSTRWIGTLLYKDKENHDVEINFIVSGIMGEYNKNEAPYTHKEFETILRKVLNKNTPDTCEL